MPSMHLHSVSNLVVQANAGGNTFHAVPGRHLRGCRE